MGFAVHLDLVQHLAGALDPAGRERDGAHPISLWRRGGGRPRPARFDVQRRVAEDIDGVRIDLLQDAAPGGSLGPL